MVRAIRIFQRPRRSENRRARRPLEQRPRIRRHRRYRHQASRASTEAPTDQMDLRLDVQRPDAPRPPDENNRTILDESNAPSLQPPLAKNHRRHSPTLTPKAIVPLPTWEG